MGGARDIAATLTALAAEIGAARDMAAGLEDAVGALLAGGPPAPGLQALDRLRQTLGDLAAFAARLAETAEGRADPAPALAAVRLGDIAARLAGAPAPTGEDEVWDF